MRFRELVETPIDETRPLRKLLLPSVRAATASTVLTASAGSIAHTIESAAATAGATPAGVSAVSANRAQP